MTTIIALEKTLSRVRNIPQRINLLVAKTSAQGSNHKVHPYHEERHKQIFPPGFDLNPRPESQRHHYAFAVDSFYNILLDNYQPHHHVEHLAVKSASYYKQTALPLHEFLVVEVEDLKAVGLRNFIVLDRNNHDAPKAQSTFASVSASIGAQDEFRVAYDGNKKKLLKECKLNSSELLEEIVFQPAEPLLLYQLATLAWIVSNRREKYHLINANCYWFAGLVWECMAFQCPGAMRHKRKSAGGWIREQLGHTLCTVEVISHLVQQELEIQEKRIAKQRNLWSKVSLSDAEKRLEESERQKKELERMVQESSNRGGSRWYTLVG